MQIEQESSINTFISLDPKKWVDAHADYLFRFAILRVRDEQAARDLVQDTFLSGLRTMDSFKGKSSERTWLTAIMKHKIIDLYRKQSAGLNGLKQVSDHEMEQDTFFNADDGHWKKEHTPKTFEPGQDPLQAKEFNKVLQACIQKLPALWASVFVMKHLDEEKTEVILSELRLTSANFWVIIHRTKLSLRACLQKNWL